MNAIELVTVFERATGKIVSSGSTQHPEMLETDALGVLIGVQAPCTGAYIHDGKVFQIPQKPSANHKFNYTTKQWEDPRTLDDLKAEKWRNIKFNRDQAERGGFTWDGSKFDSDPTSQQRIAVAVQMAQMNPAFTTVWTLADNSTRLLSAQDLFSVGLAMGAHVAGIFTHAQALRDQIATAATVQEVEAIVW